MVLSSTLGTVRCGTIFNAEDSEDVVLSSTLGTVRCATIFSTEDSEIRYHLQH